MARSLTIRNWEEYAMAKAVTGFVWMAVVLGTIAAAEAEPAKLRVGNASAQAFSFIPYDVGVRQGFFAKYGVETEKVDLSGSAKVHQALTAGAIDIGLGAGTDIAFLVKGAPELAVAQMAGPPLFLGVIVPYDSPIATADDLKGKRISISTTGSLTEWLMRRLARNKGWKRDDITLVTVGSQWPDQIAALKTGQVDAAVTAASLGMKLAETKDARLLFPTSDIVHDFIQHIIFATDTVVHDRPDAVRGFLKGWFETIAWMRANKTEAVEIARSITRYSPAVESQEYDLVMPMFSADGRFQAAGLKTIQDSFVEMGVFDTKPDLAKFYTEAFLPGATP
jgi:NitT/TauT family transport system substrate-binding protein